VKLVLFVDFEVVVMQLVALVILIPRLFFLPSHLFLDFLSPQFVSIFLFQPPFSAILFFAFLLPKLFSILLSFSVLLLLFVFPFHFSVPVQSCFMNHV
jgi:hypothetical protein